MPEIFEAAQQRASNQRLHRLFFTRIVTTRNISRRRGQANHKLFFLFSLFEIEHDYEPPTNEIKRVEKKSVCS